MNPTFAVQKTILKDISLPLLCYKCLPSLSHAYTLIAHTTSMVQNAWWPIYYWRGTPTDKQIPRNEVIWPGYVYTNTAEGFYG